MYGEQTVTKKEEFETEENLTVPFTPYYIDVVFSNMKVGSKEITGVHSVKIEAKTENGYIGTVKTLDHITRVELDRDYNLCV